MDKLDLILREIESMQNMMAAMFLSLVVFMVGVVVYLREFKNRHTIQNLAKSGYQWAVKQEKKLKRMLPNLGGLETKPDALPMLERFVAEYWLKTEPRIMSFAESIWLPIIRVASFTRDDWKRLMERWKVVRIVKQKDENARTGKGTALIAAQTSEGMRRKMEAIMRTTSPTSASETGKDAETQGKNKA